MTILATQSEIVVGAIATILGAILAGLLQHFVPRWMEQRSAHRAGLPKLVGTNWAAKWKIYKENGGIEDWVNDSVRFNQIRRGKLDATGHDGAGPYQLTGVIGDHGVLILTYHSEPSASYEMIGTVVLKRDVTNKEMTGHWCGLTRGNVIRGGPVSMRIKH